MAIINFVVRKLIFWVKFENEGCVSQTVEGKLSFLGKGFVQYKLILYQKGFIAVVGCNSSLVTWASVGKAEP